MTETFLTIAEAKKQFTAEGKKNGSFIGTVSYTGDLKSGTKNNKDFTYKKFTLKDDSDTVEITAWGNDINRLKMGCRYEFVKPYWNVYNDNPQVSFNQYGSVTEISGPAQQTTMEIPEPTTEKTTVMELPKIGESFSVFIKDETITLLQIEQEVKQVMKCYDPHVLVDQKVGMFVKEIYRESKKTKFEKASN